MNRITPFGTENFVIVPIISWCLYRNRASLSESGFTRLEDEQDVTPFGTENFVIVPIIPWCLCGNRASLSESGFTRLADEQDKPHSSLAGLIRQQGSVRLYS